MLRPVLPSITNKNRRLCVDIWSSHLHCATITLRSPGRQTVLSPSTHCAAPSVASLYGCPGSADDPLNNMGILGNVEPLPFIIFFTPSLFCSLQQNVVFFFLAGIR